MATTPEKSNQDQQDFAAAFNGADPAKTEMTEDEAFGLGPEPAEAQEADGGADEATESAQESAAEGEGATGDDAHAGPALVIAIDPKATPPGADGPQTPEDIQREKSWEGRLKAREAELKAREEALKKPAESPAEMKADGDTPQEEASEPPTVEAIEEAAEQIQSGELTADQALKSLAADFGEDFAKALGTLITARASEIAGQTVAKSVGPMAQKVDGVVNDIVNDRAKQHFESIADAHPDFIELAQSPEFKAHIDALDETKKAAAMKVINNGTARQIVKLLSSFKDSKKADPAPDPATEQAIAAAEGVRSKGMKLPDKPAPAQDYEDAWKQF